MISEHITRHIWARIKQNPIKISVMISQHITRHIWARIKQHHIRISVMISQHITRHIWAANQTQKLSQQPAERSPSPGSPPEPPERGAHAGLRCTNAHLTDTGRTPMDTGPAPGRSEIHPALNPRDPSTFSEGTTGPSKPT